MACYTCTMSKKHAGERKRTVTITIGPKTAAIMDLVIRQHAEVSLGLCVTWTDVAGVCFDTGLEKLGLGKGVLNAGEQVRHFS